MSIATQFAPTPVEMLPSPIRLISVSEYLHMIEAGVFPEGERLELLEGWIVRKMPSNPPHAVTVGLAQDAIAAALPAGWHIRNQSSSLTADSVPEPDLAIVRGARRVYLYNHPGPDNTPVVVEVSDSTIDRDRGVKRRLYARAGFPTYWIINIAAAKVEVHTDPTGPGLDPTYHLVEEYGTDDDVPLVLDGIEVGRIPVRDLLP